MTKYIKLPYQVFIIKDKKHLLEVIKKEKAQERLQFIVLLVGLIILICLAL